MTQKHFEALAKILKECKEETSKQQNLQHNAIVQHMICRIADFCGNMNPRFDRERFLKACGPEVS